MVLTRTESLFGSGAAIRGAGQYPVLRIPAELENGHKDRLLPMAFEFAHLLEAVPESERSGLVFHLERNDTLLLR